MNHRLIILATTVVLNMVLAGCSGAPDSNPGPDLPDLAGLTQRYGCGHGFWIGNDPQTVALRFQANHGEALTVGEVSSASETSPGSGEWSGHLLTGRDLYANWCNDAIEANAPQPVILEEWRITSGTVEVVALPRVGDCGEGQAWARDLVATSADGRTVEIGDLLIVNESWGCFAG